MLFERQGCAKSASKNVAKAYLDIQITANHYNTVPEHHVSSIIGTVRPLFLSVRKGAEGALINIHTNEGA